MFWHDYNNFEKTRKDALIKTELSVVRDERKEMIIKVFKPLEETAAWCQGKLRALAAEGPSRLHLRDSICSWKNILGWDAWGGRGSLCGKEKAGRRRQITGC